MFSFKTRLALLLSTGSDLRLVSFSVGSILVVVLRDCRLSFMLGAADFLDVAFNVSAIFSATLSAISSNPVDERLEVLLSIVSEDRFAGIVTGGEEVRLGVLNDCSGV